jgi:Flp pilus assembly protein TadG
MRGRKNSSVRNRNDERGIVILLVAVVLLFVVGAMAALSIDVVTFYTARSEAQMAADSAALAGARVLANSGLTSNGTPVNAEPLAITIAQEVAMRNVVGGRTLFPASGEVVVTFNDGDASFVTNPRVTVQTRRTDLPTFFARIWGSATVTVQATATAEAYNPSGSSALGSTLIPVAPTCVKPMVLPNITPTDNTSPIINASTGAIADTTLVGENIAGTVFQPVCSVGQCRQSTWFPGTPKAWQFYSGDQSSFPAPTTSLPSCASSFNGYQQSIAGCVQTPIACGSTVNLETLGHQGLHQDTRDAVNCLTHAANNFGDKVDQTSLPPTAPYQFLTGAENPLVLAGSLPAGTDVLVSDSIVTLPIYDSSSPATGSVTVIGFVQLFLNQDGNSANVSGVSTQVINIAGCGSGATGQPILGNGASPIPVRLITPP